MKAAEMDKKKMERWKKNSKILKPKDVGHFFKISKMS